MPHTGPWTREAIENFLATERPRYQKIELPFGLSTPGIDRRKTCEKIFADNLAGKSVLDVGCCNGYFCLEALARGARRAVGWDLSPDRVRHARTIADMLSATAEYHERNIEKATPEGGKETFDIVICLNVLHYVKDPIATLDKLIKLTGETLIIELASLGRRDRRNLGLSRWQSWFLARFPVMAVGGRHSQTKFFFTRSGIVNLLQFQRHHFAQVRIVDSGFRDRFIVVACRRRIQHLVIVAGPTSAGKATLIEALASGQAAELAASLGIKNLEGWRIADANAIADIAESDLEGLILSYDFLLPYVRGTRSYHGDQVFHLLETARKVSFVTLWTPPERLARQLSGDEARSSLPRKMLPQLLEICRQPSEIFKFYHRWMKFSEATTGKINRHVIVEFQRNLQFYSPEQLEVEMRNYRNAGA
jgi:2-polyprenyl-3-methyl-5-hydroxy-6-metoxy-1,4-benzoquinol methylase